jgi:hypothetical protein
MPVRYDKALSIFTFDHGIEITDTLGSLAIQSLISISRTHPCITVKERELVLGEFATV